MMMCEGRYDECGDRCPECPRFMDDCDGHPDYYEADDGAWVKLEGD